MQKFKVIRVMPVGDQWAVEEINFEAENYVKLGNIYRFLINGKIVQSIEEFEGCSFKIFNKAVV